MNQAQYKIVKCFLDMRVDSKRISREFGAPLKEVMLAEQTHNWEQFQQYSANPDDGIDFLKRLFT